MITLAEPENTLTLSESLGVLAYKYPFSLPGFNQLADWLGCNNYILPSQRELAASVFYISKPQSASDLFKHYLFTTLLETKFTVTEQINICRYIKCHSL